MPREPGGKLLPFKRIGASVDDISDRALVSAIAENDQAALGVLFDRFHRDVFRFVARLAGLTTADDLVQATFLEAHRAAPRFRGDSAVKTWLFGIAANLARNLHRGEARRRNAAATLEAVPKRAPTTPPEALGVEEQRRLLAAAVESLTPALKEVYVLCVVEEMPGKDAAQVLGIREASLYRRLTDARHALRAAIEELQR